jgi:hypothetical protein
MLFASLVLAAALPAASPLAGLHYLVGTATTYTMHATVHAGGKTTTSVDSCLRAAQ